jgi:hypothetical protein
MSLPEAPRGRGSPPLPTAYPYGQEGGEPSRLPGPTTLPPMSSLFRRDPPQEMHQPSPYLARQFQSPYNMSKQHPLWLSEMDPNAPVHHIYHPTQSRLNSHFAQSNTESMLIPTTGHHTLAFSPHRHSPNPPQQIRQFKKIVQRQHDSNGKRRQSPTSMSSGQNEEVKSRSPTREPEARQPLRRPSNLSEPERRSSTQSHSSYSQTSQSQPSKAMPISGLLSDVPRYVVSIESIEHNLICLAPQLNVPNRTSLFECVNNPSQLEHVVLESGTAESLIRPQFCKWTSEVQMPHPKS